MTIAEFRAFCDLPENKGRLFELIDGEIIEKMGGFTPSNMAGWLVTFINNYLMKNPIGFTTVTDGSYILSDDHAPMPDVGYISKVRMPQRPAREVEGAPDLAIDVKSPNDSKRELRKKAETYLRFGTKMVWLVFPEAQTIEVYLPGKDVIELGIADTLDGGDVLPSFTIAVKDIFPTE
ncbi:MAG: Uma2 family endonuclease [Chloroflexota bacterium]|nr:Uma2 family endonuclease [Chloroflexota bacterium]